MKEELTVYEKYSKHWPVIAIVSLVLSVGFFLSYWVVTDVLVAGYLRLVAFGLFALGMLSLFKIKDGQVKITLEFDQDDVLHLIYAVRDQIVYEEKWAISEIGEVKIDEMPNRSLYNDIMKSDRCLRFRRNEQSDWMYLNKISTRVVPLHQKNAERVYEFLNKIRQ